MAGEDEDERTRYTAPRSTLGPQNSPCIPTVSRDEPYQMPSQKRQKPSSSHNSASNSRKDEEQPSNSRDELLPEASIVRLNDLKDFVTIIFRRIVTGNKICVGTASWTGRATATIAHEEDGELVYAPYSGIYDGRHVRLLSDDWTKESGELPLIITVSELSKYETASQESVATSAPDYQNGTVSPSDDRPGHVVDVSIMTQEKIPQTATRRVHKVTFEKIGVGRKGTSPSLPRIQMSVIWDNEGSIFNPRHELGEEEIKRLLVSGTDPFVSRDAEVWFVGSWGYKTTHWIKCEPLESRKVMIDFHVSAEARHAAFPDEDTFIVDLATRWKDRVGLPAVPSATNTRGSSDR